MSIASNRFRVYELLFSKPMYSCAKKEATGYRNDILILGSGIVGTEAFKSIYWCGQYDVSNELNITVASANAKAFENQLACEMPGLSVFPEFANIQCVQIEDLRDPDALSILDFERCNYDYIIIALGDNDTNYSVAESVKQLIVNTPAIEGRTIISIFDEEGEAPFSEQRFTSPGNNKELVVCSFGNGMSTQEAYQKQQAHLKRLAFNIDFTYAMEQDQRVSKASVMARFDEDPYYSESSYACAVHIPYKLAMCNDFQGEDEQTIYTLIDAIAAENELYSKLIAVEHKRWVAYMVVSGYMPPTRHQLEEYAFIHPNDHRNKAEKLHPCMCACDLSGRHLDEHYDLWEADESKWSGLAELDKVSILLHQIATKRAAPICTNATDYFTFISDVKQSDDVKYYETLRQSVLKLCNDEENSIRLYRLALQEAKDIARASGDVFAGKQLEVIENDFAIVVHRNQRTDYFANDAALINRLPFCLWYGERHKTVITFTKSVLCEDIILPTILSAEKAIFVGDFSDEEHYKEAAVKYFKDRGDNTEVVTQNFKHNGVDDIASCLTALVLQNEGVIINCVDCDDPEVFIAIGTVASQLSIPVVQYDAKKGIVPILNKAPIGLKVVDKSLSIDEFTSLMGGVYKNVYTNVTSIDDYVNFSKIFWKYSKERTYWIPGKNGQGKTTVCSPWSSLANFFQSSTRDEAPNFPANPSIMPINYTGTFEPSVFKQCNIGRFVDSLSTFHLIQGLTYKKSEDVETIQFTYVDPTIVDILRPFESKETANPSHRQDCLCKKLKFSPVHGAAVSNIKASDASLCDSLENARLKADKRSFVEELSKYGMIHSVSFSSDMKKVSFCFKDDKIQHLFKTQGKIFELIIYQGFRNSGLFDDVQTSVQIAWETNSKSFEMLLLERLSSSDEFGYEHYKKQIDILRDETFSGKVMISTDNEIDVVVMLGMHPIFISCKTGKKGCNDWLNEISSISSHFHAQPVLAVMKNLDSAASNAFVSRARKMGVSLIGTETVSDPRRFTKAIREIADGKAVFGPDTRR